MTPNCWHCPARGVQEAPAVARLSFPAQLTVLVCRAHLDSWFDHADDHPHEEPTVFEWLPGHGPDAARPLEWYYGPTGWNPNAGLMWHTDCQDLIGAGHVGEVYVWGDGSASCAGCTMQSDAVDAPATAVTLL